MTETQKPEPGDSGGSARRWLPRGLVVLATLFGLLAVLSLWAERQLLETDGIEKRFAVVRRKRDQPRTVAMERCNCAQQPADRIVHVCDFFIVQIEVLKRVFHARMPLVFRDIVEIHRFRVLMRKFANFWFGW